jgi:hypothetical protein
METRSVKQKKEHYKESISGLGSGDSYYISDFFTKNEADRLYEKLDNEITWESFDIKGSPVPRQISVHATITSEVRGGYRLFFFLFVLIFFYLVISNIKILIVFESIVLIVLFFVVYTEKIPIYRHPVDFHPTTNEWCDSAKKIKQSVELSIFQELNHALIQKYRDGTDFIGDHTDKTVDIKHNTVIANVSLGETRLLVLKSKDKKIIQEIELAHGSLYVLGWNTNRLFTHGIRRNADPRADLKPRISLTMRNIATYEKNGVLIGQGANVKEEELLGIFRNMNKQTDEKYFILD